MAQQRRIHGEAFGTCGQVKVRDELNRQDIRLARCTVERLIRVQGVEGVRKGKTKRTSLPAAAPVAAPDLARRDFTATRPDGFRLAEFT